MEKLLKDTGRASRLKAKEILFRGDSCGALELMRRERAGLSIGLMNPHLDFGEPAESEAPWVLLLEKRTMGIHHADAITDPGHGRLHTPESLDVQAVLLERKGAAQVFSSAGACSENI